MQTERFEGSNAIARHSADGVIVNGIAWTTPVVIPWKGEVQQWSAGSFEALQTEHFAALVHLQPELVIFGSGMRLRFAHPSLLRPLIDHRIGVETMDSAAACRTYNVLLGEGRSVVAALLFDSVDSSSR